MRRLPPLTAVEAFIHVARLGSMKAAAEELNLSAPALSRRIQALERFVGHPLFERRHQAVGLNADGERMLAEIGPAIDLLNLAMERATGTPELQRLRLGVLPLFAHQQLMPRLPELRARHPDIHIDIDTGAHGLSRIGEGLDAAIVLAREIEGGLYARRIDRGHIVVIGTADRAEGPRRLRTHADLNGETILVHRDMPDLFDYWREAIGHPEIEPAATDVFDSGQLMLDAAEAGLGVAVLLDSLDGYENEKLAPLFETSVPSPYSYWFVCRRSQLQRRAIRIFHDWLFEGVEELKAA